MLREECEGKIKRCPSLFQASSLSVFLAPVRAVTHAPLPPITGGQGGNSVGAGVITLSSTSDVTLKPGATGEAVFVLTIPKGWHVNGPHPTEEYLFGTKATLTSDVPAATGPARLPHTETYEGTVSIPVVVQVAPDAPPGTYRISLTLSLQPCTTDRCLAPMEVTTRVQVSIV
jgi:hypothetical protein